MLLLGIEINIVLTKYISHILNIDVKQNKNLQSGLD